MADVEVTCLEGHRVEGKIMPFNTKFTTDAGKGVGGIGENASPIEYLEASLASCILTIMSLKAAKLGLDLKGTTIKVNKVLTPAHQISKLSVEVDCPLKIDDKNAAELERAARHCPVHQALNPGIEQTFQFNWKK